MSAKRCSLGGPAGEAGGRSVGHRELDEDATFGWPRALEDPDRGDPPRFPEIVDAGDGDRRGGEGNDRTTEVDGGAALEDHASVRIAWPAQDRGPSSRVARPSAFPTFSGEGKPNGSRES